MINNVGSLDQTLTKISVRSRAICHEEGMWLSRALHGRVLNGSKCSKIRKISVFLAGIFNDFEIFV